MVLEELAHSRLVVECHSADEYAQIDVLLKEFGEVDFEDVYPMSDGGAQSNPYYYVDDKRKPNSGATIAGVIRGIGDVPCMAFDEFMSALQIEENAQESDLESVSLEGVL